MRFLIFIILSLLSFSNFAQEQSIEEKGKVIDKRFMYCSSHDQKTGAFVKWVKVYKDPSERLIKKVQKQLKFLGYNVFETGVYDIQTKLQLKVFNIDHDLGNFSMLLTKSNTLLKELYRDKKKASKTKKF